MGSTTAMPHALDAAQEGRRQRAVESLGLQLDRPEERFDRIARLAHLVFDVPMSSVTVLDGDRALFPGMYGLPGRELPRVDCLCDETHAGGALLIVEDASLDERFAHLPAVTDLGIRFYAAQPILDPAGNVVGTFAIYDTRPRRLDAERLTAFDDMAAWAQQELVASTEMTQATWVQSSMLPARALSSDSWTINGMCLPSLAVGGDFYDYGIAQGVAHLGLGDVMGKGTGAALVGAGVRSALRGTHSAVVAGVDLGVTVTQVARSLMADLERTESFVTLFEAAIDLDDGYLRYVDAGSGLCLVVRPDGEVVRLGGSDAPIGVLPDDHWGELDVQLEPGDRVLMFSDGLLDLVDEQVRWWEPIGALVAAHDDVNSLLAGIALLARERTPLDDVTAVAVYYAPSPAPLSPSQEDSP
ncbi:PP2C family protein-serine/threonine phosphatase [Nocardioides sp. Leaf285]|uniref:PP2C family protein-serine/threonine phosphatase n=1 Tax=Nocardioides sp. Leaf285 TaxID=1736322 RepID=UPI0007024708|nr:SpoIIE family protein phosphatase [Nocardioides sp. Leaf285]KQP64773.1 hypothetical protein ASF47_12810 [Nocardioides sp. Leaf285]